MARDRRRLPLGGVLVVAGALELPDPAEAVRAVRAHRLLPEALTVSTAAVASASARGLRIDCGCFG
ncbi:MAG TPA: DoxX family protein, partial [Geodermatophilus sp.]|nr:DoxX family protein [Geodermatophilus sp.]